MFALKHLRDQETVNYRLEFANAEEEYAYEQRRYRSQVMMLEMVLAEMPADSHTGAQVRQLMGDAEMRHEGAKDLAGKAQFHDALGQAEIAAHKLRRAMRLTGYDL
jgi:hypothetical protein